MRKKFLQVRKMSDAGLYIEEAASWAHDLLRKESRGPGDEDNARRRLAQRCSVPYGKLWDLKYRKPRALCVSVYFALQAAYRAECERQMRQLQHDIEKTKAIAGADSRAVRAAEALVEKNNE